MANKKKNSTKSETPKNAYFLSLELENVKCFGERQKIDFSDGSKNPKQWTIILGDNGTGKTTLLKCLIAMFPSKQSNEYRFIPIEDHFSTNTINFENRENKEYFTTRISYDTEFRKSLSLLSNQKKTSIKSTKIRNSNKSIEYKLISEISSRSNLLENVKGEKQVVFEFSDFVMENKTSYLSHLENLNEQSIFAYGASRKSGKTSISEQKEESHYITLFDETALLLNPEEWLIRANYETISYNEEELKSLSLYLYAAQIRSKKEKELEQIKDILKKILPDVDDIRFSSKELTNKRTRQPIVEFHTPYGWVEAKDLSLGYRTSMAWMVDFAARMFDLYPESENPLAEPAVVLIDEIDLHLHPKWQRDLLDWLSDLCPNTQFIVTTHSPLIVQAGIARDANFAVCKREGDHVVIDQSIEALDGWRADQILSSDFFGIPKRSKQDEKDLERRKELIIKSKLTKSEQKELAELNKKVESLPVSENLEDDKAMEIIRKAANYIKENGATVK